MKIVYEYEYQINEENRRIQKYVKKFVEKFF